MAIQENAIEICNLGEVLHLGGLSDIQTFQVGRG